MKATKPTPIDLVEYVTHGMRCTARTFYRTTNDGEKNTYGECDCGLHALLDALGVRKENNYYYF